MPEIVDVSPTWQMGPSPGHSVSGRMLSLACAAGGEAVYAGSYSNVWFSGDGGQNWDQAVTDQPPLVEF